MAAGRQAGAYQAWDRAGCHRTGLVGTTRKVGGSRRFTTDDSLVAQPGHPGAGEHGGRLADIFQEWRCATRPVDCWATSSTTRACCSFQRHERPEARPGRWPSTPQPAVCRPMRCCNWACPSCWTSLDALGLYATGAHQVGLDAAKLPGPFAPVKESDHATCCGKGPAARHGGGGTRA